ncbi:tyrosine-protein phosphatase [Microbacterium sp. GXF7504]
MTMDAQRVTLEGTFNFRDTGGMPLVGGGVSASGILYRSDALSELTPAGLDALSASPIGVVVDLRTDPERQMAPDRLPTDRPFRVVELPLLQGAVTGAAKQAGAAMTAGADPAKVAAAMQEALAQIPPLGEMYVQMLQGGADTFAQFARLVSVATDEPPTAVLVHCTAGKDRTGVSTALVLDAAGVERDAVVADYASSQDRLAGPWADRMLGMVTQMGVPLDDEIRDLVAGTPASAIEQAFAWIDAQGGSAAYLRSGGLTDAELDALRARLAA